MVGRRRDRPRRAGRRKDQRDPLPAILVVCEGKNSEPQYIDGFQRGRRLKNVRVEFGKRAGEPSRLVEYAVKKLRDGFDEVWCVFDVDEHQQARTAAELARKKGIRIAISNPCFELWLLLHFRDQPGMQDCAKVVTLLRDALPGYGKNVRFRDYESGYEDAKDRARKLDGAGRTGRGPGPNPSTGFYLLMERLEDLQE